MSTYELTYENVIDNFLEAFPEFREKAEEEKEWWQPEPEEDEEPYTLPHIFLGNVLNAFLVQELRAMKNLEILKRLFSFFERMALSTDEDVPGLLTAGTLEYLGDDRLVLKRARKLMGNKTLSLSHEIEKIWGRE